MSERIDPDYNPSEDEIEAVARFFSHAAHRLPSLSYKSGNGNGFQKWVLGLMMLLVVAGVTGVAAVEYTVVQRISVLEAKVDILLMRK